MAWWNPDWSSRKAITVNTTVAGVDVKSELHDVPVLVRLHGGNFPQFLNVKDGGADFRFVADDDKTPLKYHVEKFDAAAQIALVWVKLPVLKAQSENKFYLYFGNQTANKGDDAGATYDVDTAAVFHFADAAGAVEDSTAYATATTSALATTPTSGTVTPTPLSLLGMGGVLSGNDAVVISNAPQLRMLPDPGWAISLWIKFDALPPAGGALLARGDALKGLSVKLTGDHLVASLAGATVTSTTAVMAGQWLHVAVAFGAGQLQLLINGADAGSTVVSAAALDGAVSLGAGANDKSPLSMQIDELKFYSSVRSSDFFAVQAAVEGERNDRAVGYGADESAESAATTGEAEATSQFGVIIAYVFGRKEAIVEQTVIGVCILMAAIAVMVMFVKAYDLSRARRATNRFMSAYRNHTASSGAALDALVSAHTQFGDSPLFKIYAQGIEQIGGRLGHAGAANGLNDKSLGAIRATLDATAVREQQKINSLLVLLTIAISGGPFIGLLGTVVGVMVTFATIAKTGDINIAAIAPGMAAALLATVAGLGVAIPALFGYNYLGAKARELSADMHVFGDEFIAKVNEVHGV